MVLKRLKKSDGNQSKHTGDERVHDERGAFGFHYTWWSGGGAVRHCRLAHSSTLILLVVKKTEQNKKTCQHHCHNAPHSSSDDKNKLIFKQPCASNLGQVCELPFWYDWSSPQVVDADVMGGCGHGGLQVIVIAKGSPGHPDGKLHPAHPRTLYGCRHKQKQLNNFLFTSCYWAFHLRRGGRMTSS